MDIVSAYLHRKDVSSIEATESLATKVTAGLSEEVALDIIAWFARIVVSTRTHEDIEASKASLAIVEVLAKHFPSIATTHAVDLLRTRLTICEISMLLASTTSSLNVLEVCYTPHYSSSELFSSSPSSSSISTSASGTDTSANFITFDLSVDDGGCNNGRGREALIHHLIDTIKNTTGGGGDGTTPTPFPTTSMKVKRQLVRLIRCLLRTWGMSRTGGWQQAIEVDCIPIPSLLGLSSVPTNSFDEKNHDVDAHAHVNVWADLHDLCVSYALYDEVIETLVIDLHRMNNSASSIAYAGIITSVQNMVNGTEDVSVPELVRCQVRRSK